MTRFLIAAALAALVASPALRADDAKTGQATSNRDNEAKAFAAFTRQMQAYTAKLAKATADQRKELAKERPSPQQLIIKANKLIDADAKDEAALEALLFLAQYSGTFGAKEFDLLIEHHITSPKIGRVCTKETGRGGLSPEAERFLTSVLAKNKNKEPLGLANYVMAQAKQRTGNDADALPYLEKVAKYYADVELAPGRKLGPNVKGTIFAIRNLA